MTTIAGGGGSGVNINVVVNGAGSNARFASLMDIVLDSSGNMFVVESSSVIRKITPAG
jgi:hypothetical protein